MKNITEDVASILVSEAEIDAITTRIAQQIDRDYSDTDKNLVLVCILKGSIVFMGDLMKKIKVPVEIDCMKVSSYGSGTKSSGEIKILKDLSTDIQGRDVLIVEDIIDSGNTLYKLKKLLNSRAPASVNIVTLLDKPQRREVPMEPEYTCFVIEDEFVIGYGLDYAEEYRNLPYVGVLKPCVYEK